jgi:hypothetical protein
MPQYDVTFIADVSVTERITAASKVQAREFAQKLINDTNVGEKKLDLDWEIEDIDRIEEHVIKPGDHVCDNCGKGWPEDKLEPIRDLHQRVAPGEIMPSGECPECHCLCHPQTAEATS